MGGFHNPHDFLSVGGDSDVADVIHPPRITALEIRQPLTPEQRADVARDVLVFPELKHIVLWPGSSGDDVTIWRSRLPGHIRVSHRNAQLENDHHSRHGEDRNRGRPLLAALE